MSFSERQEEVIVKKLVSTLKNVPWKKREEIIEKVKDRLFIKDFERGKFQIPVPHWWRYRRRK